MKHVIEIVAGLEKKLARLPKKIKEQIIQKIDSLADNPQPDGSKKLKGFSHPSLYRLRAGDYRIIYTIENRRLIVLIVDIGHRKEIYRK